MKNFKVTLASTLFIALLIGCQPKQADEALKPDRNASARRACGNAILYKFLFPTDDYTFNGDGCQTFYVHRGQTRQFTIQMSNTSVTATTSINIYFPNQSYFTYSVASISGGQTTAVSNPANGIRWSINNMTGGTTAQLVLNVTGSYSPISAENGLHLQAVDPCIATQNSDCDSDENMHLVLTD